MIWQYLFAGLGTTLVLWISAMLLSFILAIPLAALRRTEQSGSKMVGTFCVGVIRGIPPLMWIILIYYGISFTIIQQNPIVAAILALGIVNSAYISAAIKAGLDSVDKGQWEASQAQGLSSWITMSKIILPQAFPIMLATSATYSITLLKNTALASIVNVNDMLYFAYNAIQTGSDALTVFLCVGVIYLCLAIPVGFLARWIEGRSVISGVR